MSHPNGIRAFTSAIAAAVFGFSAAASASMGEHFWAATPTGSAWVTSSGECWTSAGGPENLQPCHVPHAPLALRLNFELDRYTLDDITNPQALAELDAYIAEVKATPREEMLTIVGHTDKLGSFSHNLALSENRAETIRDYMISNGIGADRIKSVQGVAWEGGNDVAADGSFIDLGPLENNPLRRRVVVTEVLPGK
ncbi:MAG: OmpA family protein [Thiohalocapsa sp.]|jgi:OOP family OmpA-OmpF porin|nr:OmpA family protein [Thiohalocapsa sp.]MCF7990337.1 OmpA family protein [Thiohalocapsa sp.]